MTTLDWHYKGLPLDLSEIELQDVGKQGWNVLRGDLPTPVMVLLRDALADNIAAMAAWCAERGLLLAPHGKSTMAPQIFERQLAAGAWAMTCATPWHLRVYREVGVSRIIYANELVEPTALRYVAAELARDPGFELYCLADSVAGVEIMQRELAAAGAPRPVGVLVEVGHDGARCGCRTVGEAVAVAEAITAAPLLALQGVEAFEGLRSAVDLEAALAGVDAFMAKLLDVFDRVGHLLPEKPILTAGGSAFFDRVAIAFEGRPAVTRVIRSGCYVTQDGGHYDRVSPLGSVRGGPLRNAMEIWGVVLSRPEPGLALTSFGRRDVPYDLGLPAPVWLARDGVRRPLEGAETVGLSDQHGHIRVTHETDIRPGDLLGATISHPCGAFDRWRLLPVVDDAYDVVDAVTTIF
jgi:D-serine deaminase-like pyridoxal phosphate-dependent protein